MSDKSELAVLDQGQLWAVFLVEVDRVEQVQREVLVRVEHVFHTARAVDQHDQVDFGRQAYWQKSDNILWRIYKYKQKSLQKI